MCVQTSVYIEESSVQATGVLRDLDSMTYQEQATQVFFCFVKRTSNVGMGTNFKQLTVLWRGCSPFAHQAVDRTWEVFVVHSEQFYLSKRKVSAITRMGHITWKAVKAQDEGDRHPEGVGVSHHTSQCGNGMAWALLWFCVSLPAFCQPPLQGKRHFQWLQTGVCLGFGFAFLFFFLISVLCFHPLGYS